MLCGYVLLTAEAAAYQLVFHNHTVRIPAQHDGYFLPGIVDALVCGIYLHTVLIRKGHRAFRFQESVLGKGRTVCLGHHVSGIFQGLLCIPAGNVAALAQISLLMYPGRVLCHGFLNGAHGFQLLIINLHHPLCLLKDVPGLGNHQTDGVAHTAGDISLCNHYVPVLLEMAHLVIGDILGREHGQHAGKGRCLLAVNIQNPCPRIPGADSRSIYHSLHLHVIRVLAVAQHLFPHIQAEGTLSDAVLIPLFQGLLNPGVASQNGCRQLDAFDNFLISCTAADISL